MRTDVPTKVSPVAKAATVIAVLAALFGFDGGIRSITDRGSEPLVQISAPVRLAEPPAQVSAQVASHAGVCAVLASEGDKEREGVAPFPALIECTFRGEAEAFGGEAQFVRFVATLRAIEVGDRSVTRAQVYRGTQIPTAWMVRCLGILITLCLVVAASHTVVQRAHAGHSGHDRIGNVLIALAPAAIAVLLTVGIGVKSTSLSNASIFLILDSLLLAPLIEELLFRAWALSILEKLRGPLTALFLTSAAFSLAHGFDGFSTMLTFINGLAFGVLWLRTRNVWLCVFSHAAFNAVLGAFGGS